MAMKTITWGAAGADFMTLPELIKANSVLTESIDVVQYQDVVYENATIFTRGNYIPGDNATFNDSIRLDLIKRDGYTIRIINPNNYTITLGKENGTADATEIDLFTVGNTSGESGGDIEISGLAIYNTFANAKIKSVVHAITGQKDKKGGSWDLEISQNRLEVCKGRSKVIGSNCLYTEAQTSDSSWAATGSNFELTANLLFFREPQNTTDGSAVAIILNENNAADRVHTGFYIENNTVLCGRGFIKGLNSAVLAVASTKILNNLFIQGDSVGDIVTIATGDTADWAPAFGLSNIFSSADPIATGVKVIDRKDLVHIYDYHLCLDPLFYLLKNNTSVETGGVARTAPHNTSDVNGVDWLSSYVGGEHVKNVLAEPANFKVERSGAHFVISWDEVTDPNCAGYKIYRSTSDAVDILYDAHLIATVVGREITTYLDPVAPLIRGTFYNYKIRSFA